MRCTRNKGGGEAVVSLVHNASHQTPAGVLPGKRTKDMMLLLCILCLFAAGRRADSSCVCVLGSRRGCSPPPATRARKAQAGAGRRVVCVSGPRAGVAAGGQARGGAATAGTRRTADGPPHEVPLERGRGEPARRAAGTPRAASRRAWRTRARPWRIPPRSAC